MLLSYQIKMTYANDRGRLAAVIIGLALFSQFIYIIGFTFLFSRIQAEKINYPLRLLTDAAKNIREKNLDFEIDYHSDNELGRLCSAFSDMKEELNSSLSAQWHMEQERVTMTVALAHDLGCGKAVTYNRQYHIQQPAVYTQRRQDYDGCIAWKRTGML